MSQPIFLLYGADDACARPLAASLRSVVEATASPERLHAFVLADMEEENRLRIKRSFPDIQLTFVDIPESLLVGLPSGFDETAHITPAAWLRIFAADILPPEVERVIYLDCDTITRADIADLWNMQFDGLGIGAARSAHASTEIAGLKGSFGNVDVLGHERYFNSGVLVCDIAAWRAIGVSRQATDLVIEHELTLHYGDQDALNVVFLNRWHDIGFAWNNTEVSRVLRGVGTGHPEDSVERAHIVHFTSECKPWQQRYPAGVGRNLYLNAEELTDWCGEALEEIEPLRA